MNTNMERMKELVSLLNKAGKAYYQDAEEIMSNFEYDKLYDELLELEKKEGVVLSNSPSINVGYEVLSELPKERHAQRMLSLDKTKDAEQLKSWLGSQKGLLSWKLDGLTIVLTYENGKLVKAVTRGNGEVGEVITSNAKVFQNIPLEITYKDTLILRGEAVIKYSDFEEMNQTAGADAKYKNPRNLCSGSVRQLNNEITAKRKVNFFAFTLVQAENVDFKNSRLEQINWLRSLGFDTVENKEVTRETMDEAVAYFAKAIETYDLPSDGLVLVLDDIAYGHSLGTTAKFPRDSIAFKWRDEIRETTLKEMEWSASRTGLINPVAIFEPVELEGTTVSRASVHNVSIMENLKLGIGDTIKVYKANMIIPQIEENLTKSGTVTPPAHCPVCGHQTKIKEENGVKSLYCVNPECFAKKIKSLSHFVSRNAMNIDGLSEATIEKFVQSGIIRELADLYHLEEYRDSIITMEGFGERSYDNLIKSVEESRTVGMPNFIYALGIGNIGLSTAKLIIKQYGNNWDVIKSLTADQLVEVNGIGDVIAETFVDFFRNSEKMEHIERLVGELVFAAEESIEEKNLDGITFVITGSVNHFANRNEVKEVIEKRGGKVTGSVTSKTDYLINNDNMSNSSKNKKAKELGIPIITEEEFIAMLGEA
ncbi:NAD-dependent DNA ligase LigA [[Clostridium] polysaccharolyticum]|uniref:DNA ligase n=1 Tax=[Clostridium] polysaccharolyticum TaxID=29364 RepID=A0A1H9ZS96_9FIRM|nr:NAD-dependent DNA ligase LigA [[Clostridium] polysaccharolyticum]SES84590.1 DNA ligase (NAD+) [[Clostridium] polysaccharolyticum]